jgi:hypothetical protein
MKCSYPKCKNETTKLIDGIPICKDCMLRDAAKNRGCVIDYTPLRLTLEHDPEYQAKVRLERMKQITERPLSDAERAENPLLETVVRITSNKAATGGNKARRQHKSTRK